MNQIKATRLSIRYRDYHLPQPDIDIADMDDVRKSLSKLKKGFKHRLGSKKREEDRAGANTAGERVGSPAPAPPPAPHVEDGGINADVSQAYWTDLSPHPEPVTADKDRLDDPQRKGVGIEEKEVSRIHSSLDPDVGGAAGSRPSREIKHASSPLSVTPIAPKQEPDSMWTLSLGCCV